MARMTTTAEYIRQERRNRASGTVVQVLDLAHPDAEFDAADGRWATVCTDHGSICVHDSIHLAESHAAYPEWCGDCADILRGDA